MKTKGRIVSLLFCTAMIISQINIFGTVIAEDTNTEEVANVEEQVFKEGVLTSTSDEYSITVSYDAEAEIPETAVLSVSEIVKGSDEYNQYVENTAAKIFEGKDTETGALPYARFFDITILSEEGEEIEPKSEVRVQIDLKEDVLKTEDVEFTGVHFTEEVEIIDITTEKEGTEEAESTVAFDADSFSVYGVAYYYTVDFYYNNAEYHMNGGSEMMMSDLFNKLDIEKNVADIVNIEFTNETLVSFTKDGADWLIKSLAPFKTSETLTITFTDEEVIVIGVEDAQADNRTPGTESGINWNLDASGTLTIRPQNSRTPSNPASFNTVHTGNTVSQGQATWDSFWRHSSGGNSIRTEVKKVIIQPNSNGAGIALDSEKSHLSYMFSGFTNLESVEIKPGAFVNSTKNLSYMFYGCSKLVTVTGLENIDTTNTEQFQRMFSNCTSLKEVDISSWKNDEYAQNMQNVFNGCTSLTTVKMPGDNFKVKENALLAGMFENCTALTSVTFNGMDVTQAKTMNKMFRNCSSLEELDISTFGKLTHIVNMDDFVEGCTSLKTLNIDNLDNSIIGPTSNRHSITSGQTGYIADRNEASKVGAKEFGRALFGTYVDSNNRVYGKSIDSELPNLKTISAKNSKVWMVHNGRGTPGNEYYNAAEQNGIYYFTEKEMDLESDAGPSVKIDSDRDYIDLITDRDGVNAYTTDPSQDPLPDADINVNIKDGDINTNGAGFLAPGVYTIGDNKRQEPEGAPMCDTYYRIAYIGEVPYKVEGIEAGDPELVLVKGTENTYINTQNMVWPESGSKVIDRTANPIKITYENAAIDVNGKKHDVVITVTKITFKNLENIPTESQMRGSHDSNNYVPDNRYFYRPVLQAHLETGVDFRNYVYTGDPYEPWNYTNCLGKGSGTDIDFTISIDGAAADTTFVFKGEDIDVAASQDWLTTAGHENDPCYDYLPIQNNTYGSGGESFTLGNGNKLGTLKFAEHTGLALVNGNEVISTGSDPDTTWSEFAVQADAQGSNYTWSSGISCTTYALRNTGVQKTGNISLQPAALKELVSGTLENDQFDFELLLVSKDPQNAPFPTNINAYKKNTADGKVTFDLIKFGEGFEYFPGTHPTDNNHGKGKHNTFTYHYRVKEIIPNDVEEVDGYKIKDGIVYDTTEHELYIVIKTPENDTEMLRGIKAEIYVDKVPGNGVTPDKVYWHRDTSCVDCSIGNPTNIEGDKWYDENGNEIANPNTFTLNNVKFENVKINPVTVNIPVQKILQGRPWKDTDKFAVGLVLVPGQTDAPMPANTQVIGQGEKVSEVIINNQDTAVKDDQDEIIGYKDTFETITYNLENAGKTYKYHVRELMPSETTSVSAIPGVTYDTEKYDIEVTVTLDKSDPKKPKLVATTTYKNSSGETVTLTSFTNVYDAGETDYKMEAVKDYYDVNEDKEIALTGDEFTFVLKPIGENADKAPMPEGTEGDAANRKYYKGNEDDGDIQFENNPDDNKGGLIFNYNDLIAAGIDDAALHSDEGVDFEYEMYELIPGTAEGIEKGMTLTAEETLVNNENGTYSVIGDDQEIVYDAIHHTRKITVKIVAGERTETGTTVNVEGTDYPVYKDLKEVEYYEKDGHAYKKSDNTFYSPVLETLDVEGHEDDHTECYYINGKGESVPMSQVEGYDPTKHHFKENDQGEMIKGAPIFINYRFEQKYVDLKVKKVWDDADDQDKIRPNSITVTIKSDEGDFDPTDLELKKDTWTASEKLPVWEFDVETQKLKKITYSVEETNVPAGYEVSYNPADPSAIVLDPETTEFEVTVTNKHTPSKGARPVPDTSDPYNITLWLALLSLSMCLSIITMRLRIKHS